MLTEEEATSHVSAPRRWAPSAHIKPVLTQAVRSLAPLAVAALGTSQWPDKAKNIIPPLFNPACYTHTARGSAPAPWDRFFYVGGPGGDAPNGDCPVLKTP
jgi:hypothetical protein